MVIGLAGLLGAALTFGLFCVLTAAFQIKPGPADIMGRHNALVIGSFGWARS